MRRLAHISDLHFGRIDPPVVEALVDELNADRPDLIIISGDFTMRGRRAEYAEARAFLARLERPWIAVPGNHDISPYHLVQRFLDPFARYRRYIAPVTEPVWQDEEIAVVCMNTARRAAAELNWSHGRISREQIKRIERRLCALPRHLFRIVVGHHPFLPPEHAPELRIVGRAEEALARFAKLDVKLALAGHLHRGYSRFAKTEVEGEEVVAEPQNPDRADTGRRLLVAQAASATSTRLRDEPNAYNRILIDKGHASIEPRLWTGSGWRSAETAPAAVKQGAPESIALAG